MREANIENYGITTVGHRISNLRYADNAVIAVDSSKTSSEVLELLDRAGRRRGLKLNVKNTKWMAVAGMEADIRVGSESVEQVDQYKYLGSIKCWNGHCERDIRARIAMALKRTLELANIWKTEG